MGDEWMLDWINDLIDRGVVAPEATLADLLSPISERLDREAGLDPGG